MPGIFRNREKPYAQVGGTQVFFQTRQPGEWLEDLGQREEYAKIYGEAELKKAVATYLVAENVQANWVAKNPKLGVNVWNDTPQDEPVKPLPWENRKIVTTNELMDVLQEIKAILLKSIGA